MNEILKKRIEAAAQDYVLKKIIGMSEDFENGAKYALSHQWISVEEALPGLMERVLVAHHGINRISICIMKRIPHDSSNPDNTKWHWSLTNNKEDVIAWMPMPELKLKKQ